MSELKIITPMSARDRIVIMMPGDLEVVAAEPVGILVSITSFDGEIVSFLDARSLVFDDCLLYTPRLYSFHHHIPESRSWLEQNPEWGHEIPSWAHGLSILDMENANVTRH